MVFTQASSLRLANHTSTRNLFLPTRVSSKFKCLKLRTRVPRGPMTVTSRPLSLIVTLSGISTVALARMVFMAQRKPEIEKKRYRVSRSKILNVTRRGSYNALVHPLMDNNRKEHTNIKKDIDSGANHRIRGGDLKSVNIQMFDKRTFEP